MKERKYLWWHEMTGPEVINFAKEVSDIAILPIGAIEQHGPHCPERRGCFQCQRHG